MKNESSRSDSSDKDLNEEAGILSKDQLKRVVDFLTKGVSFERFKENLRCFVYPLTTLEDTLARQDVRALKELLITRFEEVAKDKYSWLHKLDVISYSRKDLAKLVIKKTNDSPWIYFKQQQFSSLHINPSSHLTNCVHKRSKSPSSSLTLITTPSDKHTLVLSGLSRAEEIERLKRLISELCGLARVAPISRDLSTWNRSVTFDNDNTTLYVTYRLLQDTMIDRQLLLSRICNSLQAFCIAANEVQEAGFCYNCFTILHLTTRDLRLDFVKMLRVDLELASQLRDKLQGLMLLKDIGHLQSLKSKSIAAKILAILGLEYDQGEYAKLHIFKKQKAKVGKVDKVLHLCSLVVQFLCLGFLLYSQAHCRAI
jgi:hypothetical protein